MSKEGRIAKKNEQKLKKYLLKNGFNTQSGSKQNKDNRDGSQDGEKLRQARA